MTNMTRAKVLLMGPMPYVRDTFIKRISPLADLIELSSKSIAELETDMQTKNPGGHFGYLGEEFFSKLPKTCKATDMQTKNPGGHFGYLGEEFFSKLPKTCKAVCHLGAGYDDIDVQAAKKYGVKVTNTPGAVDDATATTAIYLIISAMRQFARAEVECRKGSWKTNLPLARDPEKKTLGVIGLGGIGTVVARRLALGWGMKVIYHNRKALAAPLDFDVEYKSDLVDLLQEADVVSIHLPLVSATKNYFGAKEFAAMKRGSVFVNTARGGLVDETALVQALESDKLHGVGLDVYPDEPRINPELFKHPKVTLLPHMGTETWDSRNKMALMVLDNILAALEGNKLPNLVPELV